MFPKFFENPFIALERKKAQYFPFYILKKKMTTLGNEKRTSTQLALVSFIQAFKKSFAFFISEEKIQVIVQHWIRILKIKLGWINEFDKLIVNYVSSFVLSFF
ncbi:hypothetical protein RFI_05319 [Reticulomyxa filosa]|uniref:Uncharacterized protein n=1 Tax=Reticulomyxa filosa TaxID=46433 RepID=X6NZR3_RETFI|nr:hypothetical protein RFI_05319 [Reticulomyxa filosa]|eukprot:ETO31800.1 hypothetical protein RFI_05319 [Reticulomyxa filosa]